MAGLKYQDVVNAQGGTATNPQTGAVVTAPTTALKNTMVTPPPTPTPNTTPAPGLAVPGAPAAPQSSNPFALSQVMTALETQYKTNNALMTNRNIALNALYGMPNTKEQLKSLDPTLKKVLESGDKNQLEMQIRLINDQVSGRANTLDQSVQFLTNTYTQQVQQAETQRQNSINTVLDYAKSVNQKPSVVMQALYPKLAAELGTTLDLLASPEETKGDMFAVPTLKELEGYQFYKYPNTSQVYTNTGKEINKKMFKEMTGQSAVPDDKVNYSAIKTISPKGETTKASSNNNNTTPKTKWSVDSATSAIKTGWEAEGYVQGNGKISSSDYKEAKKWWVENTGFASSTFDSKFSNLIDKSGDNWQEDYGYGT